LGGREVQLKAAQDYGLEHKNGALSLCFTVLFAQPILAKAEDFAFTVAEPTFFIAFEPAKTDPVQFGEGAPKSCRARIGGGREDNTDAERLVKAFAQLATRVSATNVLLIDCAGR
jgi:ABC-type uncharacterized transport system substrate-binding protein